MINLYVNSRLREWVEEGAVFSENLERRILRAPTLLEVWRQIITFIAIFLGILIFLAWMGLSFAFLLTGAGLVGALLTFAFQDLLKDWINGFLLSLKTNTLSVIWSSFRSFRFGGKYEFASDSIAGC